MSNTKIIYSSDLAEVIEDSSKLKEYLNSLFDKDNISVLIKNLSSNHRHLIYKQMTNSYKFEKIKEIDENISIKIKMNKQNKKRKILQEQEQEQESDNSSYSEDTNNSDESYVPTDSEDSEEEEYNNEKISREYLQLILDIENKTIEKLEIIEENINKSVTRTNLLILISIIGWVLLLTLDPVKLIITN